MSVPSLTSVASYDVNKISVYHLSPAKMIVMYLILAVGVIFLGIAIVRPLSGQNPRWASEYTTSVLLGFIIFDIFASIFLGALMARVVTSPWGIEYYSILDGIKLRAPWKSVISVENLQYFFKKIDFLVTNEPAEKSWLFVAGIAMFKARYSGARGMDVDKIRRSIPVGNFTRDLRYSKLGEEIRRYAPQAFGKESERESASQTGIEGRRGATSYEAGVAFPTARLKGEKRRRLWSMLIALAVVLGEVIFSFFVAPSIYRSVQPLLGATDPLPGQLFLKRAIGPKNLSRDGRFLAAGGQVLAFPEGTSKFKVTFPRRQDETSQTAESIALSADGKLVAAGDEDGNAFIWQVADGHLLQTFSVTQPIMIFDDVAGRTTIAYVYSVAFSPDSKRFAAVGPTSQIKVWNVDDGTLLSTMKSSEKSAARLGASAKLLFDPSGQLLISLIEGTLEIWRAKDGSLVGKVDPGDWIESVAVSADGNTLALGTLHGGIYLWDVRRGAVSKTIKEQKKSSPSLEAIYGIAISPDGKTVVSGSSLGGMQVWSVDGGGPKNMQDSSGTEVRWMAFSPDGSRLVYSKENDSSIWVWAIGSAATPADTPTPRG